MITNYLNRLFRCLMLFGILFHTQLSKAQQLKLETHWWEANKTVRAVAKDSSNNRIYIGGDFDYVGPASPFGVILDSIPSIPLSSPKPNNFVNIAIPDGQNGWFIGGSFTKIGDSLRSHIAHIDNNGNPTSMFGKNGFNGSSIDNLLLDGHTLYAAGKFTSYGQDPLVKQYSFGSLFEDSSAKPVNFPKCDTSILSAVPDGSGGWYIGGLFKQVGDSVRNRLAHINSDGLVTSWNPGADSTVSILLLHNNLLYIAGDFTNTGGAARNRLAAITLSSGLATSWNPNATNAPTAICPVGNFMYVAAMGQIGGINTRYLTMVNLTNASIKSINAQIAPIGSPSVNFLITDGITLYAGGKFDRFMGQPPLSVSSSARNLAAFDSSGNLLAWYPSVNLFPSSTSTLNSMVLHGTSVYASSSFSTLSGTQGAYLTALDKTTGQQTSFPLLQTRARTIYPAQNHLYVSDGKTILKLDTYTGTAVDWPVQISGSVKNLSYDGQNVFIMGDLEGALTPRDSVAAIDITTEKLTAWDPKVNGSINALIKYRSNIIIGGSITSVNGEVRNSIAEVDTINGDLTSWAPNITGTINAIVPSDTTLFIGGSFTSINGLPRHGLGEISYLNASPTPFNVNIFGSTPSVNYLVKDHLTLYLCGSFNMIGVQSRNGLAAVSIDGTVQSFGTNLQPVLSLFKEDNTLYLSRANEIIGYDLSSLLPISQNALNSSYSSTTNPLKTLSKNGNRFYAGGLFTSIAGDYIYYLAALDATSGVLIKNWRPMPNNLITGLLPNSKGGVYVTGAFSSIGGKAISKIAKLHPSTGLCIDNWNAHSNGNVTLMQQDDEVLYVGGNFTNIGGQIRQYLAALDTATGNATAWNTYMNGPLLSFTLLNDNIYIGGQFTSAGGQYRNRLAAISKTTGLATSWDPNPDKNVVSILAKGDRILVGGSFNTIAGQPRKFIAALDTIAGNVLSWNPILTDSIKMLHQNSNDLFIIEHFKIGSSKYTRINTNKINIYTGTLTPINIISNSYSDIIGITSDQNKIYAFGTGILSDGLHSSRFLGVFDNSCKGVSANVAVEGNLTICEGGSVLLYTDSQANVSYKWLHNNTPIPGAIYSRYTTNTSGNYTLVVSNGICTDTSTVFAVNVVQNPIAHIVGKTIICGGNATVLHVNAGAGYTYTWLKNGQIIAGETNSNLNTSDTGTYQALITNSSGCMSDTSNLLTLVAKDKPPVNVSLQGSSQFCSGDSAILVANTGNNLRYEWIRNKQSLASQHDSILLIFESGMYQLLLTDSNECNSDTSATFNIEVWASPLTSAITGKQRVLVNSNENYAVSNTPGSIYHWVISGGTLINDDSSAIITVNWDQTGIGILSVLETTPNGCSGDTVSISVSVTELIVDIDTLFFSSTADTMEVSIYSNNSWNINTSDPWISFSQDSGTGNQEVHVFVEANTTPSTRSGLFNIVSSGFTKGILVIQSPYVGTKEEEAVLMQVSAFPNPSNGMFSIENQSPKEITFALFTSEGKILVDKTMLKGNTSFKVEHNLINGIYFLHLYTSDMNRIIKLVVMK